MRVLYDSSFKQSLILCLLMVLLILAVSSSHADDAPVDMAVDNGSGAFLTNVLGENTEQNMSQDAGMLLQWRNDALQEQSSDPQTEIKKVVEQDITTKKLKGLVPAILFKSGEADIQPEYVEQLRNVLEKMRDRANVRVHFVGHTDNVKLTGEAKERYGDNMVLSKERAGITAEFFQQALGLPPEAISYEGMGETQPVATNNTEAGRRQNRRVEVQVWYDEVKEKLVDKEVELDEKTKLIKVCRVETLCKVRYKEGFSRRSKLKNLVPPFNYDEGLTRIPQTYLRQLQQALQNLRSKSNVQMRFIAYTDNIPLSGRDARIYGDHIGLSKARARRIAIAVQEAMGLPNTAISSDGKGASNPIATNDSEKGRTLNRRIEVEFWHDDPLQELTGEPQICPDQSAADTVEREYNPPDGEIKPVYFENGQPVIPPGYAQRLQRVMDQIQEKGNVRLKFVGYIENERLDRRTAMVYDDDVGLSTARARRVMQAIGKELNLPESKTTYEGHGYVQSHDVVNTGFVELDQSRVEVKVVYDELAVMEDSEGLEIKRFDRNVDPKNPFALNLMRITVDGQPLNDPNKSIPDVQRCTDVALDKASVHFKFDNLQTKPRLNVVGWPNVISILDDVETDIIENQVNFRLYSNYKSYFDRAEVRIFSKAQSIRDEPIRVIPLDQDGKGEWQYDMSSYMAPRLEMKYVLRVYDKEGNFDETTDQRFWVVDELATSIADSDIENESLVGYGENRLYVNNIAIDGGTVNVYGKNVPQGHRVWFAGQDIPVSESGEFGAEIIVPRGLHTVELAVINENGNGRVWLRDLEMERNDWFYVGIADLTAATDSTNGPAQLVTGDETHYDNDLNFDGRLAYYTKGRIDSGWTITSSADTREGPLNEIFSNFLNKAPDSVFRRIDPDYYYSTYGDDSTVEEDAPTSGKLYFKAEKNDDYGMWGNFDVDYLDTTLSQIDRSLYGANLNYGTDSATAFGDRQFELNVFAAEPGTVAGRDEFRGTSGSLYYLRHQDILPGSDRIRIEIRDGVSGLVIGVKELAHGLDYDIDYLQGRIMLNEPLSAIVADDMLVDSGDSGGNQAFLITRYEYTPGFDDIDDIATGGRLHYWVNDNFKLGLTSENQESSGEQSNLNGVDVTWRLNAGTWIKLEQSTTEGQLSSASTSNDGGFEFNEFTPLTGPNVEADGQRIDVAIRLGDLIDEVEGNVTLYNQELDAGYSAPGLLTNTDTSQSGFSLAMPIADNFNVRVKNDNKKQENALETSATELNVGYKLDNQFELSAGVRMDERTDNSPVVPPTQSQGERTDAQLRLGYNSNEDWAMYGYVQDTISTNGNRDENGRVGVGGDYRVTDRFKLTGELSSGDFGNGAMFGTDYRMTDSTNIYTNYALENERTDNGVRSRIGNLATGFKTRYSDSASIYMEEKYSHGDVPTGLMHSMGFDLAVTDRWNFGANLDVGNLRDNITDAETRRNALGLRVGYKSNLLTYAGSYEYRIDETEQLDSSFAERTTFFMRNSLKYQVNPDWRFITKLNHSVSESSLGEFYNGDFTEAVLGYAYRPVQHDDLNALFKYTYFYNLPSTDQVTLENTAAEYIQKSHILSVDMTYQLTHRWSIGGKYAQRFGEVSTDRVNPQFFENDASLYIVRLDWHVLSKWDALIEGRVLDVETAGDTRSGFLVAGYRHFGENIKLGIGYNFTDFSDDLTDLDYDSEGLFINIIGKI